MSNAKSVRAFDAVEQDGKVLTREQVQSFNRDGYLVLPGLVDADGLAKIKRVRDRAEKAAETRGQSFTEGPAMFELESMPEGSPRPFGLRKVQEAFLVDEEFKEVASSDRILDVVEDLIGPEVYYHSSKLMCKPADGGRRKAWHQDFAYWADMDPRQVTVWIAVDPATRENGCIQVINGSHKKGLVEHYQDVDYQIDESRIADEDITYAVMEPGDVLVFNVMILHASDPNLSPHPRLAAIVDYDANPKPAGHVLGSEAPLRTA